MPVSHLVSVPLNGHNLVIPSRCPLVGCCGLISIIKPSVPRRITKYLIERASEDSEQIANRDNKNSLIRAGVVNCFQ